MTTYLATGGGEGIGLEVARLIKEVWAHAGNRIAVRFAYEYRDDSATWFRAYGNANWQFDADGLMERRLASINEHPIIKAERK